MLVRLTPADYSAAETFAVNPKTNSRSRFVLPFVFLVFAILIATTLRSVLSPSPRRAPVARSTSRTGLLTSVILPILVPGVAAGAFLLYASRQQKKTAEGLLEESGAQMIRLTPEYLYLLDAMNEDKTRWPRVAGIHEAKAHLFVQFKTGGWIPIPKRAFASEAEAKAFLDEATALWKAGGGGAAA